MKTYVMNKEIFKTNIAKGLMYVGTALILMKGCDYLADRRTENRFDSNKKEVVELAENKQFNDARTLMHDYNRADELRTNDFISLNNLIDREERKYNELDGTFKDLNDGISERNLDKAWTSFKELNEMGALRRRQEDSLKTLLYRISDRYLLDKYNKGDPKQKLEIGEEYMKSYPKGSEAFNIANYVIGKRADVLIDNLMFGEKPSRILEDYKHLNDVLNLRINGISVNRFISIKGLDSLTNKYIDEKTYEKLASELEAGDIAVVHSNDVKWGEKGYLNDRRKIIELGTRGKVVDFIKSGTVVNDSTGMPDVRLYEHLHDMIFLQFPKTPEMEWSQKWDVLQPYTYVNWSTPRTDGIAAFLNTEVKGIPHMSSSQVEMIRKRLETAKDLIENYISKEEIVIPDSLTTSIDSLKMKKAILQAIME